MRSVAAFALMLMLTTAAAVAQEAPSKYVGRPLSDVRLMSEGAAITDPSVLALVETRVGQPLSMVAVRESITHLFSLGRFQDVQVDAEDGAGGAVVLVYRLTPVHTVERVDFRGQLGLSQGLLRRAVADRFGASPPIGRVAEVVRTLERLYADHGYYHATVRPAPTVRHDPDRTLLDFEITAGPRAIISTVDVTGDPLLPRAGFLARVDAAPGKPYERVPLQDKLNEYVQRLRQRGRYQAVASHRADVSSDGTSAHVTIDIRPGPPVTIRFDGDPISADKLHELVPIQREASVDEDLLEDTVQKLTAYLNQEGYWKALVKYESRQSETQLTIVFTVRKGLLYRVADTGVEIRGARAIRIEELRPFVKLAPRDVFVASKLDAGMAAIIALYKTRGFRSVDVKTAVNELAQARPGEGTVNPVAVINEGPQTRVGQIRVTGNASVVEAELRSKITTRTGDAYYEPKLLDDRDAVFGLYLDEGFESAAVEVVPAFTADNTRADVTFQIAEGPRTIVDHVLIVGNTRTNTRVIERELKLRPGQPLGASDLAESRRALAALGLFRRIQIVPVAHGSAERRDVLVTVEEAPATSLDFGGGLEVNKRLRTSLSGVAEERYEAAPRGFFDIGRRNLWGRNRSANLYARASLRPRDVPNDPRQDGTGLEFSEYRAVATYRQPRMLGPNDVTLTAAVEKGIRSSFNFVRQGVTIDGLRRLSPEIRLNARYSLSTTRRLDERLSEQDQATIDRVFPHVRLSSFSGAISRDTRDDLLEPTTGTFASGEGTIAARALGGQVGFVKTYLQGFWFRQLQGTRRLVFATRAAVGLADGFPYQTTCTDQNGVKFGCTVEDLPASERFFAGGGTSIRGFAQDRVGIPPKSNAPTDIERATISAAGFPKGGNAVLVLTGELRFPVWGSLGGAVFTDAGNVFSRVTEFQLGEIRGAAGFGLRYVSPIGPIRVDVGFKMDRRMVGGELEPSRAIHFAIGQAF